MTKRTPRTSSNRTLPLAQRWPQGWAELSKDSAELGFEPWVPRHSRLFADWNLEHFASGPASNTDISSGSSASYAYCGKSIRLQREELLTLCQHYSFLVLDDKHAFATELRSDSSAPSNLVIVNAADAFIDWLASETWIDDWVCAPGEEFHKHADISNLAKLEPGVVVGPGSVIEDDVVVFAGARIGANVHIGFGSRIGANSVIFDNVRIGSNTQMGPHCVIGTPGFGMIVYPNSQSPRQRVHTGSVVIGMGARLGAFVSIDRGVFGDTVLGDGNQIDNHVQIAHNCELGDSNVICSFVGLSGSTIVGSRSTFAGLVGTKGHTSIGSDVVIAAQTGVSRNLRDGEQVKGYPPRPMAEALKIATLTSKLPELYDRIKKLEKHLKKGD